jgi:hypothetical protein
MNKQSRTIEDGSIQKMFISCQEYDRLKRIESEYLALQKNKEKSYEIPTTSQQSGAGSQEKRKKHFLDYEDDDDEDIYEKIAKRAADILNEKIGSSVTTTDLWRPHLQQSTTSLRLPDTSPPLPFSNVIKKNDENDKFGKNIS